ncbi:MAG: hypothetical protein AB7P04_03320 [Bacteriovoracia bacterium]
MKKLFLLGLFAGVIGGGAAYADVTSPKAVLNCRIHSQYLKITKTFRVDLAAKTILGNSVENGRRVISWSLSECEDNSELSFDETEFSELVQGKAKSVWAEITHAEPDFELKGNAKCSLAKK